MTGRSRTGLARLFAVVALVGFVIAFVIVLGNSSVDHKASSQNTPARTGTSTTTSTTRPSTFAHRRTYVVKTGDTLGAIAIRTGVTVATLEDLNPGLDPQGLVAGQKLKLR